MIVGFLVALLVFGGIVWLARPGVPPSATAGGGGRLAAAEQTFDFGTVSMAAGKVSHRFAIENPSDRPVTLTKLYTSCMCTTASLDVQGRRVGPFGMAGHGFIPPIAETIAPGGEAVVEAVFDPAAHGPAGVGRIERVVTVENDVGAPLEFQFEATVTP